MVDSMRIIIYGKTGCGKCEAAKSKLEKMGVEYEYRLLEDAIKHHDGWRDDGSVGVMAAHSLMDTMPLIQIGEMFLDYPAAMNALKGKK